MDGFSLLRMGGGLALFLFGMTTMSESLRRLAGGRLQKALRQMTAGVGRGMALGALVTVALQSSSAVTVMLVSLVDAGILETRQTLGIIMGSNIGTTATAWLLSASGLRGDALPLSLLCPENFTPAAALAGVLLILSARGRRRRDAGSLLTGFAVLMYGMLLMQEAVRPLAQQPWFAGLLTAFENPLAALLAGAAFTGVIQSSAASIGILQALALTGRITRAVAIPVVLGQNIGTCVTALLAAVGASRGARRVAAAHIAFNLAGSAVFLPLLCAARASASPWLSRPISPAEIALCHTVFNLATSLLVLPAALHLSRPACKKPDSH